MQQMRQLLNLTELFDLSQETAAQEPNSTSPSYVVMEPPPVTKFEDNFVENVQPIAQQVF